MLFLDAPVGVGYSYSNTSSDIVTNGDKRTVVDSLAFLLKWFERFPQYKGRDFYITGESYAGGYLCPLSNPGHYVPQLSQALVWHNFAKKDKTINFKGFMVGNGLFDDYYDHLGRFQLLWTAGLISDQTFKKLNTFCDSQSVILPNELCSNIQDIAYKEIGDIDLYSIFTPPCTANFSMIDPFLKRRNVGELRRQYDPCTDQHSTIYFNLPEVQSALHVYNRGNSSKWATCSHEVSYNWKDTARSVLDIYRELLHTGIRIWVFSGDTDAILPVASTRNSIDALKLPTVGPWHLWYDDGQVAGWTQQYEGLNYVTVRGAGHEVPLHKPKQALSLFKSFISGNSLPTLKLLTDS